MKKFLSVLLALLLCIGLAVTVFADDALVFDEADILTDAEEIDLNNRLSEVSQNYNAQIIVATISNMDGADIDYFVEHLYDSMYFGYGEDRDGVLLLICMGTREYRILSNGFAAHAISNAEIDAIGDVIVSDLSDGYYADAFQSFADQCDYYLDGYINGYPFEFGEKLLIALVIGIVIGLIVVLILKGQLKSVRKQSGANVYVKNGSMQVTTHRDIYLYRNVSRTKKASSSSGGSSGGSSRSVGGGRF